MAKAAKDSPNLSDEEAAASIVKLGKAAVVEFVAARQALEENDTPYLRRAFVRAVFAGIAGTVEAMRQLARLHPEKFDQDELILLRESRPDLDDRGNVVERKNKIAAAADLSFAFKACMRTFGSELKLEEDPEWRSFRTAARIRDRITHPKAASDFDLSDEDVECVAEVAEWLTEQTIRGMIDKVPPAILGGIMIGLLIVAWNWPPSSPPSSS